MPEVALVPVQLFEPDAVQEVALVVDQEKVEVLLRRTEVGVAEKLIPGAGVGGGAGVSPPPPPPPPPQAVIEKSTASEEIRFMCLNLTYTCFF